MYNVVVRLDSDAWAVDAHMHHEIVKSKVKTVEQLDGLFSVEYAVHCLLTP
jgi:hypothetical protein